MCGDGKVQANLFPVLCDYITYAKYLLHRQWHKLASSFPGSPQSLARTAWEQDLPQRIKKATHMI